MTNIPGISKDKLIISEIISGNFVIFLHCKHILSYSVKSLLSNIKNIIESSVV